MDISDGEDTLEPDFPAPVAVPELNVFREICPDEVAPHDSENKNNAPRNTEEGNAGESTSVIQRPRIQGVHVQTPRRNSQSSSAQSINFSEFVQFMIMHADGENQVE